MTSASAVQFRVGDVIGQGFAILSRNLAPFGIISLAVTVPSLIYAFLAGAAAVTTSAEITDGGFAVGRSVVGIGAVVAVLLQMVLSEIAVGAISFGAFQEMRGQRADLGESLGRAVALAFPVVGVAIVAGLAIGVGMVLLLVPGLILATMLWVVIPAAVVERPGVFPSLSRSAALTKGHRWQVFGILLLIGVVYIVASFIVPRIFAAIGGPVLAQLAQWIVTAAYTAFSAVVTAVGYCTLRLAKEGVGIEEIAKVFD